MKTISTVIILLLFSINTFAQFGTEVAITTMMSAYEHKVSDVDGDNIKDIISGSTTWFKMDTNGQVINKYRIDTLFASALEVADIDNDGDIDLIAINNTGINIYTNSACGDFTQTFRIDDPLNYTAISVGDFNTDGYIDIAAINGSNLVVLYNNLNGGFQAFQNIVTGGLSSVDKIITADMDGNNTDDIIYNNSGDAIIVPSNLGGTFDVPIIVDFPTVWTNDVDIADFDNDNDNDIIAKWTNGSTSALYLAENTGAGFTTSILLPNLTQNTQHFRVIDMNNDGAMDIVRQHTPDSLSCYFNDGANNFTLFYLATYNNSNYSDIDFVLNDFNNDTLPDILTRTGDNLTIGFNNNLLSPWVWNEIEINHQYGTYTLSAGDLNGDTLPDIVTSDYNNNQTLIYYQDDDHNFLPDTIIDPNDQFYGSRIADINNDGKNDIVTGNGNNFYWYENTVSGFVQHPIITGLLMANNIDVGDYDNDGDIDLTYTATQFSQNWVRVLQNDGVGNFSVINSTMINYSVSWQNNKFTDVNNDGITDVLFGSNNYISWLRGTPTGFDTIFHIDTLNGINNFDIGFLDNDTLIDFVVSSSNNGDIYYNLGNGQFNKVSMGNIGGEWVELDDMDNDGDIDICFANFQNVHYLKQDSPYNYTALQVGFDEYARSMAIVDINNDGTPNLVTCSESAIKYYTDSPPTCTPNIVCNGSNNASFTTVDNGLGNFSFTNTSVGNYTIVNWQFGDGNSTFVNSPNHNYTVDGTFIVVLTIANYQGACMDYFIDTVTVSGVSSPLQCNAGFVMYPDTGINNVTVVNSSTGSNLTYHWDFGDGDTSNLANPIHTYTGNGPYYLCLTVDDGASCNDTYCDSVGVNGVVFKQSGFTINVIGIPITTGLDNHPELNSDINIYPNPTSHQLTIDTELKLSEITIIDITGKMITTTKKDTNIISVADLSSGVYFIKLITKERIITKKFIKQ